MEKANSNKIFPIFLMFLAAVLFWNTFLLYPVKLFVVALHELSHGIMAVLVGGKIDRIEINYNIGGYCSYFLPLGTGFIKKSLVASAGYLGSMIWGSLIFILASRNKKDRWLTLVIALMMLALSIFVIRNGELFGILFCFGFAAFLLVAYRWFPQGFHDLFLKFLGLTSCLYVIIDIKSDLIDRSGIGSDADAIANMMGAPALSIPIGIAWIILALVVLVFTFRLAFKGQSLSIPEIPSSSKEE